MNRKDFVKKAAFGAVALAGAGALAGCAGPEETAAPAEEPESWDYEADVVVAGAGNGGLSAACAAAEDGKKVILLEISSIVGGGSAWSGGIIHAWGAEDFEEYDKYTEGLHDQELAKAYIDTLRNDYFPWLESIGAPLIPGDPDGFTLYKDPRMGQQGDTGHEGKRRYFAHLANYLEGNDGEILLNTRASKLIVNDDFHVTGLQAMNQNGEFMNVKADAVVLATGNFMANKEMLQKYVGPYAYRARNMGVPYNTGEGIRMAQSVGAMLSGSMNGWSGIYCALTPTKTKVDDPETYESIIAEDPNTMPGSGDGRLSPPMWVGLLDPREAKGILVNLEGRRFKDESCIYDSKYARLPQAILHQKEGFVFMVGDQEIADDTPGSQGMIDAIIEEGGKVAIADTLEELAEKLAEQGVYKQHFLNTINNYNNAIDAGEALQLDPPRVTGHYKISTPPFYAIPTTSQIYCTYGGIAISEKAQVLDMQKRPIQGLYAVPPAAGGVFSSIYMGGIGVAGTFGYIAGKNV